MARASPWTPTSAGSSPSATRARTTSLSSLRPERSQEPRVLLRAATGFWILNPSAILDGNSVAGCQGLGRGYWYLPPKDYTPGSPKPIVTYAQKFEPVGKFRNNRVHGCFDGIFGEPEGAVTSSEQLFPKVGGEPKGYNLIARFDGFTATRIRNRAIWMRPMWFVFDNARVASNRKGVSLVTSGGLDGNPPGGWELLINSVVMGISTNNVDRWGPCPADQNGNWKWVRWASPSCPDAST